MRVLLIDTCGDKGSIALGEGDEVVARVAMAAREASAELLPAVGKILREAGWELAELDGVGVVNGPGSFTGVRVGVAAAKGLCEAKGLRLVGVSRLEVLAEAAGLVEGVAVMDAGRGEVYVRYVPECREVLVGVEGLKDVGRVVVCEEKLSELGELVGIEAASSLGLVIRALEAGGDAVVEANYVRSEGQIYGKSA